MATVCIICQKERSGEAVADTTVIRTIRAIKEKLPILHFLLGAPTGNTLVVCSDCREAHQKRRKGYERKQALYALFSIGLVGLAIALPLLGGVFNLASIFFILLFAVLVSALPLMDYIPPLARTPDEVALPASLPAPPPLMVEEKKDITLWTAPRPMADARSDAHPSSRPAKSKAARKPPAKSHRLASKSKSKPARRR